MDSNTVRELPLFEGLSDEVVEACASRFEELELLAGTGLAREGEFAYKFFVVLDGEVEVQRNFEQVATLGPGDFFGEMGVISGGRRNARVIASTRCRVGWMTGWDFEALLEEYPEVARRIQDVVDERMRGVPNPPPSD
ncbi:MAG: cyclic nucleotide-binding domain-containing protein [Ilumatobacteraceae bacterium]|nr:cyclic nucleotide-binding domain-containing protein [Ilumatobacteraceae bacterium]